MSHGATAGTALIGERVVSPALVGRADELLRLVSAVSVPPAVVVVEGEAGIGKTRLVAELAGRPELADRRFVSGACRRIREPFPLGPVIEAVRGLGEDLARVRLSPVAGALRPLLPEVADLLPAQPEPLDDRVAERHRVFRGLIDVLGSLGSAVLVLEDLHWADEQTVDFISYLVSDPLPELSVLLTFRGEEVHPGIRSVTSKLPASVGRAHVVLAPLDAAQTGALAAAILGVERVSEEFAVYMCERASGVPLAIEELLALLRARGTLIRAGGGWARKALDELNVPVGIRDSVLERVSRLSGEARLVVDAAAVLQTPVPVRVLCGTGGATGARVLRGLDEALDSRLLTDDGEAVGFRHVLAAQSVYESLPRLRRAGLHGRAAAALRAVDPPPLGQIAHHLRLAGRFNEWVDAAEKAADQAVELGHDTEASRLLEDVLRHQPLDVPRRGRIAVKLAQAVNETVHPADEVTDLLFAVLAEDLPAAVRGELRFRLGVLLDTVGGDAVVKRRLFAEAVEDLEERPELRAWAMVSLGIPGAPGIALSEHAYWVHRSLEILPAVNDAAFEVFLLGKAAMVLVSIGDPAWRRLTDRIIARTGGSPQHRREVNAYYSVGMGCCSEGHYQTAQELLTLALAGARACESRELELRVRSTLALLDYCRGCWDGLAGEVQVLMDELADFPPARVDVELVAGCLALAGSDLVAAERRLVGVTRALERMLGGANLLAIAVGGLLRLTAARGDTYGALTSMRSLVAVMESKGFWAPAARVLPAATHAMVTVGQHSEASALVARCAGELGELDAPLALAAVHHANGLLAVPQRRWRHAARHFVAAAELYEALPCPYEAAQAREQAAASLLAAGDVLAEDQLRAAVSAYQHLGASWDYARTARLARRHGVAVPARHGGGRRSYGPELSPREREVAELAATGRTNKEIGSELFLSPSTVDKHLRAALRKLGLHSRTALAHHLAGAVRQPDGKDGEHAP